MELYEWRFEGLKEIRIINYNMALTVEPKKSNSDTSMDDNHEAYLVRKMKKLLNSTTSK